MSFGYDVLDGKITDFRTFILSEARCIDYLSGEAAPIALVVAPDDYYAVKIKETERALAELRAMTEDECFAEAEAEYHQWMDEYRAYLTKKEVQTKRIDEMLAKVQAWIPPTPQHERLKSWMIEDLKGARPSDRFTFPLPTPKDAETWRKEREKFLLEDLAYYTRENEKVIQNARERNAWVAQLFKSLEKNNG